MPDFNALFGIRKAKLKLSSIADHLVTSPFSSVSATGADRVWGSRNLLKFVWLWVVCILGYSTGVLLFKIILLTYPWKVVHILPRKLLGNGPRNSGYGSTLSMCPHDYQSPWQSLSPLWQGVSSRTKRDNRWLKDIYLWITIKLIYELLIIFRNHLGLWLVRTKEFFWPYSCRGSWTRDPVQGQSGARYYN